MMLLEVQYGWSAEFCGASFMSVGAATMAATIISTVVVSRKWIRESWLFLGSTLVSLSGVFLLFDWPFYGVSGGGFLLLADSLVYAFSGISMGIAQGWATRAAMKGTTYDIQTFRVQNLCSELNNSEAHLFSYIPSQYPEPYAPKRCASGTLLGSRSAGSWPPSSPALSWISAAGTSTPWFS